MVFFLTGSIGSLRAQAEEIPGRSVDANGLVTYDASQFSYLKGRTKADIENKYLSVLKDKGSLTPNTQSYYITPSRVKAPYHPGVLKEDALKSVENMDNYVRWLVGVKPITGNHANDESLQAQALDRNFRFAHYIDQADKPADMDQALWDKGFECTHHILSRYSGLNDAIIAWLNEGYNMSNKTWDTVGHRTALLTAATSTFSFGYSGAVAIGKIGSRFNSWDDPAAAFPAAGYMPNNQISAGRASWTVELNSKMLIAENPSAVEIKITNLNTKESWIRKKADDTAAIISSSLLNFVQPELKSGSNSYGTDSYQVDVNGLKDKISGGPAKLTYTVKFFDLEASWIKESEITLTNPDPCDPNPSIWYDAASFEYTGKSIIPDVKVVHAGKTLVKGTDYTLRYMDNIEAGSGYVEVTGIGNYKGVASTHFWISKDIHTMKIVSQTNPDPAGQMSVTSKCKVCGKTEKKTGKVIDRIQMYWRESKSTSRTYYGTFPRLQEIGASIEWMKKTYPEDALFNDILVTSSDPAIVEVDQEKEKLTCKKAGTAKITVQAKYDPRVQYDYYLTVKANTPTDISKCTMELSSTSYVYDGSLKKPEVVVMNGRTPLYKGYDYNLSYSDNLNVGRATVTVSGIQNYSGSLTATFQIKPAKAIMTGLKNYTAGIYLTWDKVEGKVTGYQIYRKASGESSYKRVVSLLGENRSSYTDKTVEAGKTYTYKIRGYHKNASGVFTYGTYSSTKTLYRVPPVPVDRVVKTSTGLSVRWTPVANITGYKVYRKAPGEASYTRLVTLLANDTRKSYTDKNAKTGVTYSYKIRAYYKTADETRYYGVYSAAVEAKR